MLDEQKLQELVRIVREKGPHRVMVNRDEATPIARAKERGIAFDVVFIRRDGWTLGASHKLEHDAELTWRSEWQAKVDVATGALTFY